MKDQIQCVVVCGPTACGKTKLGVELARRINGEIISVDSRQVYRGMDLGTGKDLSEYGEGHTAVPYHCIDCADPRQIFTLFDYQRACYQAIRDIRSRNKTPILTGGTGLYLQAVIEGYLLPCIPEDVEFRLRMMERSQDVLVQELKSVNPTLADKSDLSSKKRIVRALEITRSDSNWLPGRRDPNAPDLAPSVMGVRVPRDKLRSRIDTRLLERLDAGMVEEVKEIRRQVNNPGRFDLFGLEYSHTAEYLDNHVSYDEMGERLRRAIHRFAKRQETWFRGMERRGTPMHWLDGPSIEQALGWLQQQGYEM